MAGKRASRKPSPEPSDDGEAFSPALEQFREEKAKLARLDRIERERQLAERDGIARSPSILPVVDGADVLAILTANIEAIQSAANAAAIKAFGPEDCGGVPSRADVARLIGQAEALKAFLPIVQRFDISSKMICVRESPRGMEIQNLNKKQFAALSAVRHAKGKMLNPRESDAILKIVGNR